MSDKNSTFVTYFYQAVSTAYRFDCAAREGRAFLLYYCSKAREIK